MVIPQCRLNCFGYYHLVCSGIFKHSGSLLFWISLLVHTFVSSNHSKTKFDYLQIVDIGALLGVPVKTDLNTVLGVDETVQEIINMDTSELKLFQ